MMMRLIVCSLVFLCSSASRDAQADQGGNAVQKVIQMLGDMLAKCKRDKQAEEVAFAEFGTWCTNEKANLDKSIKSAGEEMETLSNGIGELQNQVKELGKEIGTLQGDLAKFSSELKAEVSQRKKDYAAFVAQQQDFSESVDAIDRAIVVLQKQSYDRPGASAVLMQLSESAQLPQNAKAMIQAFMGMDESAIAGQPEANAYEFQSGSVVDMLKKLRDDFSTKLADVQKEEMNSKHASDMVVQDLKDAEENAKKDVGEKTVEKEKKAEAMALSKKELQQVTANKAEDSSTLKDMKGECFEKKMSFEEKQKLRAEEIEAVDKAIEILSDPEAMSGTKHLALAQASTEGTSLAQFMNADKTEGIRKTLMRFFEQRAKKLHSQNLQLLAEKLVADPFGKVKKMIEEMITRLLAEAKGDAEHEGFCDKEMGESKITRNKLTEDVDGLEASVEEGKAQIMLLAQEKSKLTAEVAELDKAMAESTDLRTKEKSKNKETILDATQAIKAVEAATTVLKDFYAKASVATALVQGKPKHQKGMQTFGESFTGSQEEAGGVMALLEVILGDFSNLKATTEAAETEAARAYDDFMVEAKRNKATKSKAIEMDEADKIAAESKLESDTQDLKQTQDQLLAAERYYKTLVPQCLDKGQTFKERTSSRQEEIASLKEALQILSQQ